MEVSELYDKIIEYNIASEETLNIITDINGYSVDTLNDVIYAATGYRSIEQFEGEEEFYFSEIAGGLIPYHGKKLTPVMKQLKTGLAFHAFSYNREDEAIY